MRQTVTTQLAHLYRLLVAIVELDPETALPGDWLNCQTRLVMFRVGANVQMKLGLYNPRPSAPVDPEQEVRAILPDLRQVVRQYAAGGYPALLPITAQVGAFGGETSATRLLMVGSPRDMTILAAVHVLALADRPPIGLCPEDGKVFLRVRHQRYCSRQCVNRANMRAHRQRALTPPTPKKKPRRTR